MRDDRMNEKDGKDDVWERTLYFLRALATHDPAREGSTVDSILIHQNTMAESVHSSFSNVAYNICKLLLFLPVHFGAFI
ncbi:hypothetical protein OUZ56_029460 [Daphnia magna]|uniref:Uncharacterized protein n=1 Tax=Daphnia magna TaxID=35525 RepID=A0ABR0B7B7_9CRUS|nr:hypothetical protein OUZ56_029460 [Daphnia magna]